jgi:hypothetical protein
LAPVLLAHAAAQFDGRESGSLICPGETDCERFRTAAGTDAQTKAANACTGCSLLSTKAAGEFSHVAVAWTVSALERIRRERGSGGGIDLNTMDTATWELVQLWDRYQAKRERTQFAEIRELLPAWLAKFEAQSI